MHLLLDEPIFEVSKKKLNNLIKRSFNNTNTDDAMNKTVAFLKSHLR